MAGIVSGCFVSPGGAGRLPRLNGIVWGLFEKKLPGRQSSFFTDEPPQWRERFWVGFGQADQSLAGGWGIF